ncbi:MAG: type IV pilus modification protein PilV [Steroidobacteraceae bacterium]
MTSHANQFGSRQRGVTLVEILVTVVLISVGLLGIAALQMASLRGNQEAHVRAQASVLAADILDRIRANSLSFRAGDYDVDYNGTGTAGTRAGSDLTAWQAAIDRTLTGTATNAAGKIERVGSVATVTVRWYERASSFTGQSDGSKNLAGEYEFKTRSEI